MPRVERKLTTVVAADVVGYSRLMAEDETGTLEALMACRSIIDQIIQEHHGRIFGSAGDSVLAEFASPVQAVLCAREFQGRIGERNASCDPAGAMQFRVGINIGDVIIEGQNLYGEGVNIAARLQAIAQPGGVCISHKVYEEVRRKIDFGFVEGGLQTLKNIPDPISIYHLGWAPEAGETRKIATPIASAAARGLPLLAIGELKTISGGDEVTALTAGLIAEIRNFLGHQTAIAVVSGGDSKADFVLEGSVRASGKRLRLTFALLEGLNRRQIWSERYDRTLDDLFELEDEISQNVASVIRVRVKAQIFERLVETENEKLSVAELLDKAAGYFVVSHRRNSEAEAALRLALEQAPDNSMAIAMLAFCLHRQGEFSAAPLPEAVRDEIVTLSRSAVTIAPDSYFAHLISGLAHYDLIGNFEAARHDAQAALDRNPAFTQAQALLGIARIHLGEVEEGLDVLGRAIAANKADPHRFRHLREQALGHFVACRLETAIEIAGHLVEQAPDLGRNRLFFAVLLQAIGDTTNARTQWDQLGEPGGTRQIQIGDGSAAERFADALASLVSDTP
jgi:class 3 adenylate cyclase/tetratricopeptide (TPR) repeat protein